MKLSACYIVKNEAASLPRSVASLGDAIDELVVVDTGSTDATVAVAERLGAQVYPFAWQDDFAAARNAALDRAAGDWIFFIDADEFFATPLMRAEVEAYLRACPAEALLLRRCNVNGPQQRRVDEDWTSLRVLRARPWLRYRGRVHEQLTDIRPGAAPLRPTRGPAAWLLLHTGYDAAIVKDKMVRNLRLLQQEIAAHGHQPVYDFYLADCYFGLADYAAAARAARAAIESPVQMLGDGIHIYHLLLESLRQLGGREQAMLAWADRAIAAYPAQPEFYAEKGMTLSALDRLAEARAQLIEALLRYEQRAPGQAREGTYFGPMQAGLVAARLGEIMLRLHDVAEAQTWLTLARRYAPEAPAVQRLQKKFAFSPAQA